MNEHQRKPWYEVYHEIALKLRKFYKENGNSSGQALFKLVNSSSIYREYNSWLSNMSRIKNASIEPIQLFTSFSRSRQNNDIRLDIIYEICRLLNVNKNWDEIDFEGCPAPMALKLQYVRPENVQVKIWHTFDSIMKKGSASLTEFMWEEAKTWRGIQIPSFTIFLFWVNSKYYLPLDKNTKQYLEQSDLLQPNSISSYEVYKGLLNNKRIRNYTHLALEAYYFVNHPKIFKEKFKKGSLIQEVETTNTTFRLVGLRILNRNGKVHKILKPKIYYPFDYDILPEDNANKNTNQLERFKLNETAIESLYDLEDLKINITAVVGKNGSGKSTLLDLLLMGIYNLSIKLGYLDIAENKVLTKLNFEIYWQTDTLYKLIFGDEIQFYSFRKINDRERTTGYELIKEPKEINELIENFFYSVLVNSSHYALNSRDYKIDWITSLSHKNDGYITPLVINPMRTAGNINVNKERGLLNMRLLLNLLELHDDDIPQQSFRYIDNGKYINYFSIRFDEEKQKEIESEAEEQIYDDIKFIRMVMLQINKLFGIMEGSKVATKFNTAIEYYIVNKLFTIIGRYNRYKEKFEEDFQNLVKHNIYSKTVGMGEQYGIMFEEMVESLLKDIKDDKSHITLKLRQAINYLKYPVLRKFLNGDLENRNLIELNQYNLLVNKIINEEQEEYLTVAELLPPAIFKLDFHFNDNDKSSFSKASSGEYQLISVVSSIIYHIRNIDSIDGNYRYNYITILLDEIELYFHPNMQRFFIKKLIDAFSKLETELYGIHVLLATHLLYCRIYSSKKYLN